MVNVFKECNSSAPSGDYMPWVSLGAFRADYYDDGRTHSLRVLALGMVFFAANDDCC